MSAVSSNLAPLIVLVLLISFVFARRIVASVRGARISETRFVIYAVFVLAVFSLTVATGALVLPVWALPADVAALAAFIWIGATHVGQRVRIIERAPGEWVYILGPLIPVLYLVLFLTRLVLDVVVLNVDPLSFTLTPPALSPVSAAALVVVDLLFAVSAGLVVGRTIGVYRAYRVARSAADAKATPLP